MSVVRMAPWASLLLLSLPASLAQTSSSSSSQAAIPSATSPRRDCATNLVKDGTFEDLTQLSQSNWTVTADGAACDIVNDGYDSSGHAFWVYNPRLSGAASCILSQSIKKPREATEGTFSAHILARSGSASILCTLAEKNGTTILAEVQDAPATGDWTGLNKTIKFSKEEVYQLTCKLTCPPDGSLRVDDIIFKADKGGKCEALQRLPPVGNYKFAGCHTESQSHRVLPGGELVSNNMTLEKCAGFCKDWSFFGVEYGRECFCGENVARDSKTVPLKDCNAPCTGNTSQTCGGPNRLSLYHDKTIVGPIDPPKITNGSSGWIGCYTETGRSGGESRTLTGASFASNNMSLNACEQFCIREGLKTSQKIPYKYWGVEYGRECYCGDTIANGAAKVQDKECQQICSGNPQDSCGGPLLVSLYQNVQVPPSNITFIS